MSRTLEQELHDTLLDIAPETHELTEQAVIVAESAAIYRAGSTTATRSASKGRLHEARLMDSLLQAMGRLAETDADYDDFEGGSVDGIGMSAEQIINRAASSYKASYRSRRMATKGFGDDMDILGDDDLDDLLSPKGHDDYSIEDGEHDSALLQVPGFGRHRSDSHSRS